MPFERKLDLRNPDVLKRIFDLRNSGKGFNNIAKLVKEEFELDVTPPTVKNLYYEFVALQKVKTAVGETPQVDLDKHLLEKFNRIERITSSLLEATETLKDKLTPELYLKHAPVIVSILREALNQLNFIRQEQAQITFKQQNLIYSPMQIIQEITRIEESKTRQPKVINEILSNT